MIWFYFRCDAYSWTIHEQYMENTRAVILWSLLNRDRRCAQNQILADLFVQ